MASSLAEWLVRRQDASSAAQPVFDLGGVATSIGVVRPENQDRAAFARLRRSSSPAAEVLIGAVCDGVGGLANGLDCAVIALSSFLTSAMLETDSSLSALVVRAIGVSNQLVYEKYVGKGGSTLSGFAIASNGDAVVFNVGDSKTLALLKSTKLRQLTIDDTLGGHVAAAGQQVFARPEYDQLVQFIGGARTLEPRVISIQDELDTSEISSLLVMTDGALIMGVPLIEKLIISAKNPRQAALRCVTVSDWLGGPDNSSVVHAKVDAMLERLRYPDPIGDRLTVWDAFGVLELAGIRQSSHVAVPERGSVPEKLSKKKAKRRKPNRQDSETYREDDMPVRPTSAAVEITAVPASNLPIESVEGHGDHRRDSKIVTEVIAAADAHAVLRPRSDQEMGDRRTSQQQAQSDAEQEMTSALRVSEVQNDQNAADSGPENDAHTAEQQRLGLTDE